jgi:UDP-galactopyranose mutase
LKIILQTLSKIIKSKKILIVGAGPVGCTIAEILSKKSFIVDIFDSRNHIAGNCFDFKNQFGVLVHKYGPHYFRTNNKKILKYLSKFTKWIPGKYFVSSYVDKQYYDFPINLNTINKFFKKNFTSIEAKKFLKKKSKKINKNLNFETYLISQIGEQLYRKFYKNYTIKQWGVKPNLISASVAKRVPIKFNRNKDYIISRFKFMPKKGFTSMFKKMISHTNINIKLNKKYKYSHNDLTKYNNIVFTGPIDSFFNFKFGKLGWRSLKFNFVTYKKKYKQHCLQINYPNNYKFTRKVEYKHVTQQKTNYTTISKEYPKSKGEPYYPRSTIKDKKILKLYEEGKKYFEKKGIYFAGRLAQYKYINTDQAIEIGMSVAKRILLSNSKRKN